MIIEAPPIPAWLRAISIMMLGIAVVHGALLLVVNDASFGVKLWYERHASIYYSRALSQNWQFFAPQPVDHDVYVLARGRANDGTYTPWTNITKSLLTRVQANRLSRFETLLTGVSNSAISLENRYLSSRGQVPSSKFLDSLFLQRIASGAVLREFPLKHFETLEVRLRRVDVPEYTTRNPKSHRPESDLLLPKMAFMNSKSLTEW